MCLAAVALAATGCNGSSPPGAARQTNSLCRRYDAKIAKAEAIAPGVWFTANTLTQIQAEVDALARSGPTGKLSTSFRDWEHAKSLILQGGTEDARRGDLWLLRAKAAASSADIHCSFGARPLADL